MPGPLRSVAKMIGVDDKYWITPAFAGLEPTPVPYIVLILWALLALLMGVDNLWKVVLGGVGLFYLYQSNQQAERRREPRANAGTMRSQR